MRKRSDDGCVGPIPVTNSAAPWRVSDMDGTFYSFIVAVSLVSMER
jgi:hypothetical protein